MPENTPSHTIRTNILIFILIIAGLAWYAYPFFIEKFMPVKTVLKNEGYILLNLTHGNAQPIAYVYDVSKKGLFRSHVQMFTPSTSSDGNLLVGTRGILNSSSTSALFTYDISTKSLERFAYGAHSIPRLAHLSPNNRSVIFNEQTSASSTSKAFYTPDSWNIYQVSKNTDAELVAEGMYPNWLPDSSGIVYLKNDGIHALHFQASSSIDQLIWPMNGSSTANMMITVSKDGKYIAWTNPANNIIGVMSVTSWAPFMVGSEKDFNLSAFWPVFSPDGSQLAMERIDWHAFPQNPDNARLTIIDLNSGDIKDVAPLTDFNQMALFVTNWADHL